MSKQFYITTAIDYVNGEPHLGHAYEKVISDVIARSRRSFGQPSFFLTGLDEHGQKVQQAATDAGKAPQAFCDSLAGLFRNLASGLNLTISDFVRTSEPRHKQVVQAILSKLHAEGQFYKAQYEGFYSTRQETFLTDKDRRDDGSFDPFYGEVIPLVEENYYFRLRDHQAWLIDYINSYPDFVQPDIRRNEVLGFLKNNALEDLCISRPRSRLEWGIPLPFDTEYVTYVWFDALVNYVTIPAVYADPVVLPQLPGLDTTGVAPLELWPADIHVVGKDILKFHAVYWPIMLKAIGLPLPGQILAHGWWQIEGRRMSKSTGNYVDPIPVIQEWGVDAFRYYLVRELDIGADGNWTEAGFKSRYQSELANGLGNLVNRSLSMLRRYRDGRVPDRSDELSREVTAIVERVRQQLLKSELQAALLSIWTMVTRANQYVDQTAPFKLAKDPDRSADLDRVLYNLVEVCRILALLLWPFIPDTATRIYAQLGLPGAPDDFRATAWGALTNGHTINEPIPLFPRKDA